MGKNLNLKLKLFAGVVIAVAFIVIFRYYNIQDRIGQFLEWIPSVGPMAPFFFGLFYAIACVLFIPGSLLTLGAGAIFGVVSGTVIVSLASTLGATLCFLIGRYFARAWISTKVDANPKFKAIDDAVADEGWKIVVLTRLSPIFPFTLLNYGYGITKVSLRDYFFASWIGMFPGTVMYVYLGSVAGDIASMGSHGGGKTLAEWILYGIGLLATITVTIFVTKIAKKALAARVS